MLHFLHPNHFCVNELYLSLRLSEVRRRLDSLFLHFFLWRDFLLSLSISAFPFCVDFFHSTILYFNLENHSILMFIQSKTTYGKWESIATETKLKRQRVKHRKETKKFRVYLCLHRVSVCVDSHRFLRCVSFYGFNVCFANNKWGMRFGIEFHSAWNLHGKRWACSETENRNKN